MMNAEQIALEVAREMNRDPNCRYLGAISDNEAIEFFRRCLAKLAGGVEPLGLVMAGEYSVSADGGPDKWRERKKYCGLVFTAEAILAAEQRVAETITKMIADERFSFEQGELWRLRTELILAIRSGAWREYL